jgi:hypothetical protein
MRTIRPSSEAEMIAQFLQQEYACPERYGASLGNAMNRAGVKPDVIVAPDLTDIAANDARRQVLAAYRGYGTGESSYLSDFPDRGVTWSWVGLDPDELLDSLLIRYLSTDELTAGTRSPRIVAERIQRGELHSAFADRVRNLADRLRAGIRVAPVILVSANDGVTRVILEGNTRIMARALAPETIPTEVEAILGTSPEIARWDEY